MPVPQAINRFRSLAEVAGFTSSHEGSAQDFCSSVTRIARGDAELRLVWDGRDEYLALQISHGPSRGPQAGWLELFGSKCCSGVLCHSETAEDPFLSAVQYGLELMSPGASQ